MSSNLIELQKSTLPALVEKILKLEVFKDIKQHIMQHIKHVYPNNLLRREKSLCERFTNGYDASSSGGPFSAIH